MIHGHKNLVFEGGGVKGIAYGGALEELQKNRVLPSIRRVAGTSAGAINAALFALDYSVEEISKIISKTDFASFADNSWVVPNIFRLVRKYGWNRGETFFDFIGDLVEKKTGDIDFTFKDLDNAIISGESSFKHLYVVATNLSKQIPQVFSHESTHFPGTPIRNAVRMSMGIPLYFQAYQNGADVMVDGGVSLNYPVGLFDNKKYIADDRNGEAVPYADHPEHVFNHETLGFRLDSKSVIEYAKRDWAIPPEKITNIKTYSSALLNFMMEMANKSHLHSNDWNRTIFIDTLDVKTTDFSLPQSKIDQLLEQGRKAVLDYFKWKTGADSSLPVKAISKDKT